MVTQTVNDLMMFSANVCKMIDNAKCGDDLIRINEFVIKEAEKQEDEMKRMLSGIDLARAENVMLNVHRFVFARLLSEAQKYDG